MHWILFLILFILWEICGWKAANIADDLLPFEYDDWHSVAPFFLGGPIAIIFVYIVKSIGPKTKE